MINEIKTLSEFCSSQLIQNDSVNIFFNEDYINLKLTPTAESFLLYSDSWVIPAIVKKKSVFRYAEFLSEPYTFKSESSETQKAFLNDASEYLRKKKKVQWINQSSTTALFANYPDKADVIPFGSHIIDLTNDEDTLMAKMHSKHRNVVKKAIKDGVIIKAGGAELLEDYYLIDKETWERSSLNGYSKEYYKAILESLPNNTCIYISYLNDQPQTGAIIIYNKQMSYYMYGASIKGAHNGAGNLLQWEVIRDMKRRFVLKYSFVGCRINVDESSKYYGIQRFKERFGGALFEGYLFKVIYNKFNYKIYQYLISLAASLKARKIIICKDVIDQEIYKWKN